MRTSRRSKARVTGSSPLKTSQRPSSQRLHTPYVALADQNIGIESTSVDGAPPTLKAVRTVVNDPAPLQLSTMRPLDQLEDHERVEWL
jgi:hypothetical protein